MLDKHWHETNVNTELFLQLQDLTTVLSQIDRFEFEFSNGAFIDIHKYRITGSMFWDTTNDEIQSAGYKTDIYLRSIGTLNHSKLQSIQYFFNSTKHINIPQFANQLFTLLEDLRLEELIKHNRPGTTTDFLTRKSYLKHFFTIQLITNATRGFELDELFCIIYLSLQSNSPNLHFPHANDKQVQILEHIKSDLFELFDAKTTKHIANLVIKITEKVSNDYKDMTNNYFAFPIFQWTQSYNHNTLFDEITRTDDVQNKDAEEVQENKNEYFDETLSTWHHESENEARMQTFLQMDLEVGTKTNLIGGGARQTESGDQAFASAQGVSGMSNQEDYSKKDALEKHDQTNAGKHEHPPYGEDNFNAVAKIKNAEEPTDQDKRTYKMILSEIEPFQRKLARTIEKVIEHKKESPRKNLQFGRLEKNLLPIIIDKNPRVFYKKNEDSTQFDAIFTLLVDCSASMHQKMDKTKHGIVLFHEVLKRLKIPHSIIGFWEESSILSDSEYPNYFHMIHKFSDSLYKNNGAKIMQLEPKEDNRDGFTIRVITEEILKRNEKHKFLLIFSDGEPAAANYEQNGIIDTHIAVTEARKQGIDVIGMFLSDQEITEREDEVMKNIYGRERLMVPNVAELPELFSPILKKLLLKTL